MLDTYKVSKNIIEPGVGLDLKEDSGDESDQSFEVKLDKPKDLSGGKKSIKNKIKMMFSTEAKNGNQNIL